MTVTAYFNQLFGEQHNMHAHSSRAADVFSIAMET